MDHAQSKSSTPAEPPIRAGAAKRRKTKEIRDVSSQEDIQPGRSHMLRLPDVKADPLSRSMVEIASGHWQESAVGFEDSMKSPPRVLPTHRPIHLPARRVQLTTESRSPPGHLEGQDGAGEDWWVECSACDTAWQVPHYAESVGH
jgi:hypothetical protein